MDAAGLGITLFVEVYHVAVYIKEVEHTRRRHPSQVEDFQQQLDRETVFLEVFNDVYFKDDSTFRTFQALPNRMKEDIKKVYEDILRHQADYRVELLRHGIDFSTSSSQKLGDLHLSANDTLAKNSKRDRLKEKLRELAGRADLQWALFDKARIVALVEGYKAQTHHLRDLLTLNLLLEGTRPKLAEQDVLRNLRLEEVATRQRRAGHSAPSGYGKLDATVDGDDVPSQENAIAVRTLKQSPLEDRDVVVETRLYDEKQRQGSDSGDKVYLKPIEQVIWLLQSDRESSCEKDDDLFTLRCAGYIDQPSLGRSLLCYELPTETTRGPRTLHDLISSHSKNERTKPALGHRFRLAHRLCTTLLQVHLSKWVHKRIWSRGVVVFQKGPDKQPDLLPYLQGWGLARRAEDETQLAAEIDVEANLYHHAQRWARPTAEYEPVHDIYSLGVVLLEIGAWRTVSVEFKKTIEKFNSFVKQGNDLNSTGLFDQKHKDLLTLASSRDLNSQMGARYAEMARWCLESAVAIGEPDGQHSVRVIQAFKTQVVEVLARYIDM